MNTLYMMIGLPGSGKSTIAKELSYLLDIPIVSSDQVRMDVTGSEENFDRDIYIWNRVIPAKLNMALLKGDVILDATNLTEHYRNELKKSLSVPAEYVAIVVNVPVEECLKRQQYRDRKVPEDILLEMASEFVKPCKTEIFSNVYTIQSAGDLQKQMETEEEKEICL